HRAAPTSGGASATLTLFRRLSILKRAVKQGARPQIKALLPSSPQEPERLATFSYEPIKHEDPDKSFSIRVFLSCNVINERDSLIEWCDARPTRKNYCNLCDINNKKKYIALAFALCPARLDKELIPSPFVSTDRAINHDPDFGPAVDSDICPPSIKSSVPTPIPIESLQRN
ncbi:hypothetical protein EVAR_89803_1, partial [Eumeta japonica]